MLITLHFTTNATSNITLQEIFIAKLPNVTKRISFFLVQQSENAKYNV